MEKLRRHFQRWTRVTFRSIAFLPLPMTLVGILLGCGLFYIETSTSFSQDITDKLPAVILTSQDTARNVLGLFIGGLITLMVFSFTQMMTLFNQVANSYSPRLLPFFTGDRSLQFTMGFYLGSIVMSVIVLLSIRSDDAGYIPNVSVLVCIAAGFASLLIFIYFVTAISSRIQVETILLKIYDQGIAYIEEAASEELYAERAGVPDTAGWQVIASPVDGYLGTVDHEQLSALAGEFQTRFYLGAVKGQYIPAGFPVIESEVALADKQIDRVLLAVQPQSRKFGEWELHQLDLLIEIAQRALSPGINDPGTASSAIDRITGLLSRLLKVKNVNYARKADGGGEVWFRSKTHAVVIGQTLSRLRNYARQDTFVMRHLVRMIYQLWWSLGSDHSVDRFFHGEALSLVGDASRYITNEQDRIAVARDVKEWRAYRRHGLLPREVESTDISGDDDRWSAGTDSESRYGAIPRLFGD